MLYQLHWQFPDGHTEMKAQRDVTSGKELEQFVVETREGHPLPGKVVWVCIPETSKYFVKAAS